MPSAPRARHSERSGVRGVKPGPSGGRLYRRRLLPMGSAGSRSGTSRDGEHGNRGSPWSHARERVPRPVHARSRPPLPTRGAPSNRRGGRVFSSQIYLQNFDLEFLRFSRIMPSNRSTSSISKGSRLRMFPISCMEAPTAAFRRRCTAAPEIKPLRIRTVRVHFCLVAVGKLWAAIVLVTRCRQ